MIYKVVYYLRKTSCNGRRYNLFHILTKKKKTQKFLLTFGIHITDLFIEIVFVVVVVFVEIIIEIIVVIVVGRSRSDI